MHNHNSISIDEAKFLKTSKKLLTTLSTEHKLDLKLSQMQEILAQSLGFRNLHDLQKNFTSNNVEQTEEQNKQIISSIPHPNIFSDIGLDQAMQIICNLMDNQGSGDMWRSRAISLLSSVMHALLYMRDQNEIILSADLIREYLLLDNVIKLYKTRKDFPENVRNDLRAYLLSLPSFQESAPKQSDTVSEQHGYLQMQFLTPLNRLKNIENNNFVVADYKWFVNENKEFITRQSVGKQTEVSKEYYKNLTIHPSLKDFDFLEDSWLSMNEYQNWISSLFNKRILKEIRVSDLLVYVTTIISPHKREKMYLVLNSILNNYSIASQVSYNICKVISQN